MTSKYPQDLNDLFFNCHEENVLKNNFKTLIKLLKTKFKNRIDELDKFVPKTNNQTSFYRLNSMKEWANHFKSKPDKKEETISYIHLFAKHCHDNLGYYLSSVNLTLVEVPNHNSVVIPASQTSIPLLKPNDLPPLKSHGYTCYYWQLSDSNSGGYVAYGRFSFDLLQSDNSIYSVSLTIYELPSPESRNSKSKILSKYVADENIYKSDNIMTFAFKDEEISINGFRSLFALHKNTGTDFIDNTYILGTYTSHRSKENNYMPVAGNTILLKEPANFKEDNYLTHQIIIPPEVEIYLLRGTFTLPNIKLHKRESLKNLPSTNKYERIKHTWAGIYEGYYIEFREGKRFLEKFILVIEDNSVACIYDSKTVSSNYGYLGRIYINNNRHRDSIKASFDFKNDYYRITFYISPKHKPNYIGTYSALSPHKDSIAYGKLILVKLPSKNIFEKLKQSDLKDELIDNTEESTILTISKSQYLLDSDNEPYFSIFPKSFVYSQELTAGNIIEIYNALFKNGIDLKLLIGPPSIEQAYFSEYIPWDWFYHLLLIEKYQTILNAGNSWAGDYFTLCLSSSENSILKFPLRINSDGSVLMKGRTIEDDRQGVAIMQGNDRLSISILEEGKMDKVFHHLFKIGSNSSKRSEISHLIGISTKLTQNDKSIGRKELLIKAQDNSYFNSRFERIYIDEYEDLTIKYNGGNHTYSYLSQYLPYLRGKNNSAIIIHPNTPNSPLIPDKENANLFFHSFVYYFHKAQKYSNLHLEQETLARRALVQLYQAYLHGFDGIIELSENDSYLTFFKGLGLKVVPDTNVITKETSQEIGGVKKLPELSYEELYGRIEYLDIIGKISV